MISQTVERPESAPPGEPVVLSVSQLARALGITPRAIRFYEDKQLIRPGRAGQARVYTHRDRVRLLLVLRGKRLGFSLREIREFLDLYDADPAHLLQTRQLLGAVRKRIGRLREQRAAIEQSLGGTGRDRRPLRGRAGRPEQLMRKVL